MSFFLKFFFYSWLVIQIRAASSDEVIQLSSSIAKALKINNNVNAYQIIGAQKPCRSDTETIINEKWNEARSNFKQLMLKFHPDRFGDQTLANEITSILNNSHEALNNTYRKALEKRKSDENLCNEFNEMDFFSSYCLTAEQHEVMKNINIDQKLLNEILDNYKKLSIEDKIILKGYLRVGVHGQPDHLINPVLMSDFYKEKKPRVSGFLVNLVRLINDNRPNERIASQIASVWIMLPKDIYLKKGLQVCKVILEELLKFDSKRIKSEVEIKLEDFYNSQIGYGCTFEEMIKNKFHVPDLALNNDVEVEEFIEFLKTIFNENLSYICFTKHALDEKLKRFENTEIHLHNLLKNPKLRFIGKAYDNYMKKQLKINMF